MFGEKNKYFCLSFHKVKLILLKKIIKDAINSFRRSPNLHRVHRNEQTVDISAQNKLFC